MQFVQQTGFKGGFTVCCDSSGAGFHVTPPYLFIASNSSQRQGVTQETSSKLYRIVITIAGFQEFGTRSNRFKKPQWNYHLHNIASICKYSIVVIEPWYQQIYENIVTRKPTSSTWEWKTCSKRLRKRLKNCKEERYGGLIRTWHCSAIIWTSWRLTGPLWW